MTTNADGRRTARFRLNSVLFGLLIMMLAGRSAIGQADILALEEAAIKAAVANVSDSTVRIETVGGLERVDKVLIGTGPTTGLIVDPDGYIVSSAFNFIQKPTSILVTLPNGQRTAAEIVARDHSRKVVLLKIEVDEPLPVPTAVPQDEVQVGQWSVAIGRTFGEEYPNVSVGIISATNRIWGKAIQTDCKVSPANYGGPLVDIRGRVYGILLPLSPEASTETAGAEWYDSGIGFCVSLENILKVLPKLKSGQDLHSGLLGITLRGKNTLADPAIVASVPAGTPAAKAGLRVGDEVVEIDGRTISRHAELKLALGPLYAEEKVALTVLRDRARIELNATLTDSISPYDLPFFGILPMRYDTMEEETPLIVRYVYKHSPAAVAGILPGDQLLGIGDKDLVTADEWRTNIASKSPGETLAVCFKRAGATKNADVKLSRLPEAIPDQIPAAFADGDVPGEKADERQPKLVEIKIAEHSNQCVALLPHDFENRRPHGVVLWLTAPGESDRERLKERWAEIAAQFDLIVLAPEPKDIQRWRAIEVEFIRKTLDRVIQAYNVDPLRIVAHGHQGGASLGFLAAFRNRELVRGVAAVDSTIPRRMVIRANDPVERLSFYFSRWTGSNLTEKIDADIEKLRNFKYPVTLNEQSSAGYLDEESVESLARWIDSLDRI